MKKLTKNDIFFHIFKVKVSMVKSLHEGSIEITLYENVFIYHDKMLLNVSVIRYFSEI